MRAAPLVKIVLNYGTDMSISVGKGVNYVPDISCDDDPDRHEGPNDAEDGDDGENDSLCDEDELIALRGVAAVGKV